MSSIPWGGWLKEAGGEETKAVAGCDFVVFPLVTALATLQDTMVGKILEIDALLGEGLLKTINSLPVDAVLVTSEQEKENLLTFITANRIPAAISVINAAKGCLMKFTIGNSAVRVAVLKISCREITAAIGGEKR
jgi:hypothetical protein